MKSAFQIIKKACVRAWHANKFGVRSQSLVLRLLLCAFAPPHYFGGLLFLKCFSFPSHGNIKNQLPHLLSHGPYPFSYFQQFLCHPLLTHFLLFYQITHYSIILYIKKKKKILLINTIRTMIKKH
jgi:hypothetical protein